MCGRVHLPAQEVIVDGGGGGGRLQQQSIQPVFRTRIAHGLGLIFEEYSIKRERVENMW